MGNWGSRRIANLVQSDIRAMTRECNRVKGINLGQGLCELPTPKPIVRAAQSALNDDMKCVYSPAEGILPLRQAIAKKLAKENGIVANPETQIVVTNGATGGFSAALMALLNPGDGLLVFEPYYGYHVNTALLSEIEPQYIPMIIKTSTDDSTTATTLIINEQAIRDTIKPNTKAILICTPNNPSGKMWTQSEIDIVAKIANEFDLLVITDEMYEYFRFENRKHISPMTHPKLKDRTVTLMGLSKTFSITGWRLGYVVAAENLALKIKLANDLFYVCAPTPLQHGVLAGFTMNKKYFSDLQKDFTRKRDMICSALDIAGMTPIIPEGAYYVLADITHFKMNDSKAFAMLLLEKAKIATIPGRAFFNSAKGDNYIRLCFGVNDRSLKEACQRIVKFGEDFDNQKALKNIKPDKFKSVHHVQTSKTSRNQKITRNQTKDQPKI
ncbi:MAG: pyridoxal phosphate-dependent aminotransferase [Bdellovibrionales bacterium]